MNRIISIAFISMVLFSSASFAGTTNISFGSRDGRWDHGTTTEVFQCKVNDLPSDISDAQKQTATVSMQTHHIDGNGFHAGSAYNKSATSGSISNLSIFSPPSDIAFENRCFQIRREKGTRGQSMDVTTTIGNPSCNPGCSGIIFGDGTFG